MFLFVLLVFLWTVDAITIMQLQQTHDNQQRITSQPDSLNTNRICLWGMRLFSFSNHQTHIISRIVIFNIYCEIPLRRMPYDLNDDRTALCRAMARCHKAACHYLNCWIRSLSPYGVTRPQLVNCGWARNKQIATISLMYRNEEIDIWRWQPTRRHLLEISFHMWHWNTYL